MSFIPTNRLRVLRAGKRLSQRRTAQLAAKLLPSGLSYSRYLSLELEYSTPREAEVVALAALFGCSAAEVFPNFPMATVGASSATAAQS